MILLLVVATLLALTEQCQEITMVAKDGTVIVGRSMEFAVLDSYLITEPAGTEHEMPNLPNCEKPVQFTSKYHSFKTRWKNGDVWSKADADGMNSAGLSFSGLYFPMYSYFPEAEDVPETRCDTAIPHVRLGEFVLASFGTVQEIREAIENDTFPMVYAEADFNYMHPIHYQFVDQTGDNMIVEYTKQGRKCYNNTVGVYTNSPSYEWHMENLRNYPHLQSVNREGYGYSYMGEDYFIPVAGSGSGLAGINGDYTSVSRFVKAATLVRFAEKPKDRNEALVQTFHLMNAADIPTGIVQIPKGGEGGEEKKKKDKKEKKKKKKNRGTRDAHEEEEGHQEFLSDATSYIMVKSLAEGCLYYRAYYDLSIKRICFKHMKDDVSRWIPIERKWKHSYKDIKVEDMKVFQFDGEN